MKKLASILLMIAPILASAKSDHKFYVSTTIIELNAVTGTLEITVKLFTDDLEQALQINSTEPIRLGDEREHPKADEWTKEYVEKHFSVRFNSRDANWSYIGKEVEFDLTYVYFEIAPIPEFNVLDIKNELLFDQFEEQVNIIHLRFPSWRQTIMFDKQRPEITINR